MKFLKNSFVTEVSLRAFDVAKPVSYGQHGSDTTCYTPVQRN
jgi:hypothetical protein